MWIFNHFCAIIYGIGVIFLKKEFEIYMNMLLEWNEKINLTAIIEPSEIEIKHFADSLTCLESGYIKDGDRVLDVGTGAGFPGIPIKIENRSVRLTLMDSLNKRINFLKAVSDSLGLDIDCVHERAEQAGKKPLYREKFDVAVSRAVANLSVLAEYCLPFVKVGGYMLAMKGKEIDEELNGAREIIKLLGGEVSEVSLHKLGETDIVHSIVVIKKVKPTHHLYPRNGKKVGTVKNK